jgi:hypothetical protein
MFAHNNARRVQLNRMTYAQLTQLMHDYQLQCAVGLPKVELINLILAHEAAQQAAESSEVEF